MNWALRSVISAAPFDTLDLPGLGRYGTLRSGVDPSVLLLREFLASVRREWKTDSDLVVSFPSRTTVNFVERSNAIIEATPLSAPPRQPERNGGNENRHRIGTEQRVDAVPADAADPIEDAGHDDRPRDHEQETKDAAESEAKSAADSAVVG